MKQKLLHTLSALSLSLIAAQVQAAPDLTPYLSEYNNLITNHPDIMKRNLDEVIRITQTRTPEREAQALADNDNLGIVYGPTGNIPVGGGVFITINGPDLSDALLGLSPVWGQADAAGKLTKTKALLAAVSQDTLDGNSVKDSFNYPRPFITSNDVVHVIRPGTNEDVTAGTSGTAFPSGHAALGYSTALILSQMLPELSNELLTRAADFGESRIVMGVHHPLDVIGGRMSSEITVTELLKNPEFVAQLNEASQELRSVLSEYCGGSISSCLQVLPPQAGSLYTDPNANEARYTYGLTYGFNQIGQAGVAYTTPEGAELLLANRFKYLSAQQRADLIASTAIDSGYPLENGQGWQRMNLYAASNGFLKLDKDINVVMTPIMDDAAGSVYTREDTWSNDMSGAGRVIKSGDGRLNLTGDNTIGGVVLNGGILTLTGTQQFTKQSEINQGLLVSDGIIIAPQGIKLNEKAKWQASGVIDAPVSVSGELYLDSQAPLLTMGSIVFDDSSKLIILANNQAATYASYALTTSSPLIVKGKNASVTLGGTLDTQGLALGQNIIDTQDGGQILGTWKTIIQDKNLLNQGLQYDLVFTPSGVYLAQNPTNWLDTSTYQGSKRTGADIVKNLRNSSIAYGNTRFNAWMNDVLQGKSVDTSWFSEVSGQLHADTLAALLTQPRLLDQSVARQGQSLINSAVGSQNLWAEIIYNKSDVSGNSYFADSDSRTQGLSLGWTKRGTQTVQSYAVSYQQVDIDTGNANADADIYQAQAQLKYFINADQATTYVGGLVSGAYTSTDTKRHLGIMGTASGSRHGQLWHAGVMTGTYMDYQGWSVNPEIGLYTNYANLNALNERGSDLALRIDRQHESQTYTRLSLSISKDTVSENYQITPSFNVAYEHSFNNKDISSTGRISDLVITQRTVRDNKNYWEVGAGVNFAHKNGWSGSGRVSAQTDGYQLNFKVAKQF